MAILDWAFVLLIARSCISSAWTLHAIRHLESPADRDPELSVGRRLVVILPVLEEALLIRQALAHLTELKGTAQSIEVWVVGSVRERDESDRNPTLDLAREFATSRCDVRVLEDPRPGGWMAHQVNFALNTLKREHRGNERIWVLLVNIDSQLSTAGLETLFSRINQGVPIIQQSAVFLSNFARLDWLLRGFAIWQSRWTIAHELRRFAFYRRCRGALVHVVGHGLCIATDVIWRYQLLPEDTITEDLHFGFYLAAHGERIESIPVLEVADNPENLTGVLQQKFVWSFGPMLYPRYFALLLRKFPGASASVRVRGFILMLQGVISFIDWSVVSWVLIGLLLIGHRHPLALATFALYFLDFSLTLSFFARCQLVPRGRFVSNMFATMVAGMFHSLPANVAFLRSLLHLPVVKTKTKHE